MTTNIPAGWKIEREPTGELVINGPHVGVVVRENPFEARLIPEEALFMLASALLDAPTAAVPGEPERKRCERCDGAGVVKSGIYLPNCLACNGLGSFATPTAPQAVGAPVAFETENGPRLKVPQDIIAQISRYGIARGDHLTPTTQHDEWRKLIEAIGRWGYFLTAPVAPRAGEEAQEKTNG